MINLLGKQVFQNINKNIVYKRGILREKNIIPKLNIILVNPSQDDIAYKNTIVKKCIKIDILCEVIECKDEESFKVSLIKSNDDKKVHSIIVMGKLDFNCSEFLKNNINPNKDVDGISYLNMAKLYSGDKTIIPCTAEAVLKILDYYDIPLDGKNITVIGRSNIIGKPLFMSLLSRGATVTICHSHTTELVNHCKDADILCCAVGKPKLIKSNFVNKNMVVIDVGINFEEDGSLCGDVDYSDVSDKVSAITPVPGGVGTVTNMVLIEHVIDSALEI